MTQFPSAFGIGEKVILQVATETYISVYVRAVTFTSGKVRYSLFNKLLETSYHNVDSAFLSEVPESEREVIEMPFDNFS